MIHTKVKQKVSALMGGRHWTQAELAVRAGVARMCVNREVNCTGDSECQARHTPAVQEAIAKALGTSAGELFGRHAWFRIAGHKLAKMERRKAS